MTKCVIYVRYSSDSQREASLADQERECREYAKRNDMSVLRVYSDKALSARTADRPAFLQMVKDAEKGEFEKVVTYKISRFSRSRYDAAHYKARLKSCGVTVEYAAESIPDGPEGIMLEAMLEGMSEYYSAELSQNIRRGMEGNALLAKYNGGSIPLGLRVNAERKFEPCPDTKGIVQKIFTDIADGRSIKSVIDELNEKGVTTTRGTKWKPNSLNGVLRNQRYIGTYTHSGISVPNAIEPIIDRATFDKVQARLKANKNKRSTPTNYLLSGKLFCGHCKERFHGITGKSHTGATYAYYACRAARKHKCNKCNVKQDYIENLVIAQCQQELTDENVAIVTKEILDLFKQQEQSPYRQKLLKELRETQNALENLSLALERGEEVDFILGRIKAKREGLRDVEDRIEKDKENEIVLTEDEMIFFFNKLKQNVDSVHHRAALIATLVNRIYLYDDKFEIIFNAGEKSVEITIELSEEISHALGSTKGEPPPPNSFYPNPKQSSDSVFSAPLNSSYPNPKRSSDSVFSAPPITAGQRFRIYP